jgi:hypothetical protein
MNIIWPIFVLWPFFEMLPNGTTQLYLHLRSKDYVPKRGFESSNQGIEQDITRIIQIPNHLPTFYLRKTKSLIFNYLFTEFGNSSYRCNPLVPSLASSETILQTSRLLLQWRLKSQTSNVLPQIKLSHNNLQPKNTHTKKKQTIIIGNAFTQYQMIERDHYFQCLA